MRSLIPGLIGAFALALPTFGYSEFPPTGCDPIEQLSSVPLGWTQQEEPPDDTLIQFRLAVTQENAAVFEQKVLDLSTPGHSNYGQHMKRDQVKQILKPPFHVSEAILSWLDREGISKTSVQDQGDWINFAISVAQAEKLLQTKFYYFSNSVGNDRIIRTLQYCVPHKISPYVHMIQPTTRFRQPQPDNNHITNVEFSLRPPDDCFSTVNCSRTITPACIRKIYNMGDATATPDPRNKLGISGYLDQYARYSDFDLFLKWYAPQLSGTSFAVASINGGLNLQNSSRKSIEASLDVQYAISLSNATSIFYSTKGRAPMVPDLDLPNINENSNEPYLDQLHHLLGVSDEDLPAVLTTSYGENERTVPEKYASTVCNLFAQLGARGVSVIFASGDSGAGSSCQSNDGKNTTRFDPIFPATCPFVTSVGGTHGTDPEYAVSFSSGGFSDRYPRPAYQDDVVSRFLNQLGNRWDGLYNPAGRGFPDVAAQSGDFQVVDKGEVAHTSGTSAAAPVFAAIISILNSMRLAEGKPVLGFLNPLLYALKGAGFNDIVTGVSEGCKGTSRSSGLPTPHVPGAGWNATVGWDPVTGLGTPDFAALAKLVKDL
ncbi:hypothetical protein AJ79_04717 [Helicocarpus griseus UAMH5409]|uniref:tripeptidyl-peptidase II n=1 Tax=Helicocarpus griseus UAMH5409 TaxID=1447875 RepID=A0A2B7XIY6_9EURO|nr:hypothetical protein AJ79_04717 [Helicocarpus griseus UAMH5409]